jgi:hypothetical protein
MKKMMTKRANRRIYAICIECEPHNHWGAAIGLESGTIVETGRASSHKRLSKLLRSDIKQYDKIFGSKNAAAKFEFLEDYKDPQHDEIFKTWKQNMPIKIKPVPQWIRARKEER